MVDEEPSYREAYRLEHISDGSIWTPIAVFHSVAEARVSCCHR